MFRRPGSDGMLLLLLLLPLLLPISCSSGRSDFITAKLLVSQSVELNFFSINSFDEIVSVEERERERENYSYV